MVEPSQIRLIDKLRAGDLTKWCKGMLQSNDKSSYFFNLTEEEITKLYADLFL